MAAAKSDPTRTYHTLDECASIARAPVATVRYWIELGKLKSVRPGRRRLVRADWLYSFIENGSSVEAE